MPGVPDTRADESIAFLQKTSSKNGQSVFDHFVDVVQQVRPCLLKVKANFECTATKCRYTTCRASSVVSNTI